jgi:hypothetical protein
VVAPLYAGLVVRKRALVEPFAEDGERLERWASVALVDQGKERRTRRLSPVSGIAHSGHAGISAASLSTA